jgi:hypothetical protein
MFVLCSQHNNKPIQFAVDPKEEITILLLHTHREMWSVSSLCVYVFYFFFLEKRRSALHSILDHTICEFERQQQRALIIENKFNFFLIHSFIIIWGQAVCGSDFNLHFLAPHYRLLFFPCLSFIQESYKLM